MRFWKIKIRVVFRSAYLRNGFDKLFGYQYHLTASITPGTIPFPESMIITPAEDNDLTTFKQAWGDNIFSKVILGDKAYSDKEYFNDKKESRC